MKYRNLITFLTIAITLLLASCCKDTTAEKITAAEVAIQSADYESAQEIVTEITSADSISKLGCENLCRLSIIYMRLSEHQDEEENVASATNCYHHAVELNPDSASVYFSNLPLEDERYVSVLSELNKYYDLDSDSIFIDDDQGLDSLFNEQEYYE